MDSSHDPDQAGKAKLLLALLALVWGLSWPIMRIALQEVDVWSFRVLGYSIGAASLLIVILLQRRPIAIPRGRPRWHVLMASLLNVVGFGLFSSFAQISGTTTRVVIVNYSMPIWASVMAYFALGERLTSRSAIGLLLCVGGLTALVVPVATTGALTGLLLALGCALCWGGGTIYMKWARIPGDLLAVAVWQMLAGVAVLGIGEVIFRGWPRPALVSLPAALAVIYNGVFGTGVAYLLWFTIIQRLPATTAALGSLATPVVGVASTMAMLGERPSAADFVGFALIFAAAGCVLLQPRRAAVQELAAP